MVLEPDSPPRKSPPLKSPVKAKPNPLEHVAPEVLAPAHETHPELEIDAPIEDIVNNIAEASSPTTS
jgi:hypothetical protein